jgi:hypothetical protein
VVVCSCRRGYRIACVVGKLGSAAASLTAKRVPLELQCQKQGHHCCPSDGIAASMALVVTHCLASRRRSKSLGMALLWGGVVIATCTTSEGRP